MGCIMLTIVSVMEYEPVVLGNEPVEDERALRERLFKPLKRLTSRELVRGLTMNEPIIL